MKQTVNLRHGDDLLGFGDEFTRKKWEAACVEALTRQTVEFAIAPWRALKLRGRLFRPGDEVKTSDFDNVGDLENHIRRGDVLVGTHLPGAA